MTQLGDGLVRSLECGMLSDRCIRLGLLLRCELGSGYFLIAREVPDVDVTHDISLQRYVPMSKGWRQNKRPRSPIFMRNEACCCEGCYTLEVRW